MSEPKYSLPKFDGKISSDFHLWCARMQALLEAKDLWIVVDPEVEPSESTDGLEDKIRKASSILV